MPSAKKPRRPKQLELKLPCSHGGKRKRAGRKPVAKRAGVPHRPRSALRRRMPIHVTLRMAPHVYNLRSRRSFRVIDRALCSASGGFGVGFVEFSVQGNHVHLLVESSCRKSLGRAMKGLGVRLARGLNRMMGKRGAVLEGRYHSRVLATPTEVKRCIHYIQNNYRHHAQDRGQKLTPRFRDEYSTPHAMVSRPFPVPTSWLLTKGIDREPPLAPPRAPPRPRPSHA